MIEVEMDPTALPLGRGEVLRRGRDLVIFAVGPLVYHALEAAAMLADEGKDVAVVNCRFVKPLDEDLILEWALKTEKVLTLEENVLAGGFGSAVLELLAARGYRGAAACLGVPDCFLEHGDPRILREALGLDPAGIVRFIRAKGW